MDYVLTQIGHTANASGHMWLAVPVLGGTALDFESLHCYIPLIRTPTVVIPLQERMVHIFNPGAWEDKEIPSEMHSKFCPGSPRFSVHM